MFHKFRIVLLNESLDYSTIYQVTLLNPTISLTMKVKFNLDNTFEQSAEDYKWA